MRQVVTTKHVRCPYSGAEVYGEHRAREPKSVLEDLRKASRRNDEFGE